MLDLYCTVVSFNPFKITEEKPGIYPGRFNIPPSDGKHPEVLHVGNALTFLYVNDTTGSVTIPKSCDEVAESIVKDFCQSQLEYSVDAGPAMFWVPGQLSPEDIEGAYQDLIQVALRRQRRWFLKLVQLADDDWQRYHQHKSVSDTQRLAARSLGFDREWLIEVPVVQPDQTKCIWCKSLIDSEARICPICREKQEESSLAISSK